MVYSAGRLYHTGGISYNGGILDGIKVFSAAASAAGTVDAWTPAAALPEAVYYHAGAAVNGHLYVLGGFHYTDAGGIVISNVVYRAKAGADGVVGAWETATSLPQPVFFPSAAVWNGRIYVTGGWNGSALVSAVYSAEVHEDGSLGLWVTQRSLPQAVYTHAAVSNGTLYVLGGTVNGGNDIQNTVYFAKIGADGSLAQWATTTPLPTANSNHGAVVVNGRVFVLGGWTGAAPTEAVHSSLIADGGGLGDWAPEAFLPRPLYLLAATASPSHVFVSGGIDNAAIRNEVYALPLPPPPPPADSLPPQSTFAAAAGIVLFGIDLMTPETALTITATDPVDNGISSGVRQILYSVDGGPDQIYAGAFYLPAGNHTVSYGAVDNAGNAEDRRTVSLSVSTFLADTLAGFDSVSLVGGAGVVGNVRSNGAFTGKGNSWVRGDVTAMSVSLSGKSAIGGTITQGRATLPAAPYDLSAARAAASARNNNAAIPAQFLSGGALTLSRRQALTLPAGDYYLTGLTLKGRANLSIDGRVNLFLDGPLTLRAGSRLNDAGQANDLWIVGAYAGRNAHEDGDGEDDEDDDAQRADSHSGAHDVCLSGKVRAAFHLYAPLSTIALSGHGEVAGRLLGKAVSLSGKALQPSTTMLAAPTPRSSHPLSAPPSRKDGGTAAKSRNVPSSLPPISLSARAAFAAVGGAGRAVRAKDRSAVVIPEGAATGGLGVSVSPPGKSDILENRRRADVEARKGLVAAASGVQYGPEGARFAKPVTLELPYERAGLPSGVSENDLAVHYWNPVSGDWEKLDSSVDTQNQVVRAQTAHFSLYQIFGGGSAAAAPGNDFYLREVYAFPNPARGGGAVIIRVQPGSADSVSVRVYDLVGRLVHESPNFRNRGSFDDGNGSGPQSTFEYAWSSSGVAEGVYSYIVTARKLGSADIGKTGKIVVLQ